MYVANTHLKPVIGLDIHFVNLPFPFVPLPHPYIGLVIDPFDYLPFIGATVKVNNVPRGNTDTAGMLITFIHIPFGAGFSLIPLIGHDSTNFFGSKTVQIDGAPMSGAGYVLMTCNDIGLPLSFQPGKKFKPIPSLYLPTSFCIPLQWGKPVMVGGPMVPHFSLMALLKAFAFGSLFKVFGKVGGKVLSKLKGKLSKSGLSDKLQSAKCILGRDPVDLITGRVTYEHTDFELPGAIPIKWNRTWDSDASFNGAAGHGVQLSYDRYIKLWPEEECLSLVLADGRLAVFPILYYGESFYHPQEKMLLHRKQNGHFLLEDYNDSLYYHFNHDVESGIWRLSFIENYSGNRIQLHYTGKHLRAITDSAGRQLLFTLDDQQRITEVTVKHREVEQLLVFYMYNSAGDLIAIADALNQVTTIEYHDHLMIKQTDRDGQSFYWEYDEKRRCTHTWGDGGIWEGFIEYHKGYNIVTNSLDETTTYYYDENNLCIQETDHYGNHKYTEYTENFEIYREIDEAGNITGYTYDEKGLLKEKTWPDGSTVRYVYNEYNQLSIIMYPNGSSQTFGYDDSRRLRFINYPNGKILNYQYNEEGQLIMVIEGSDDQTKLTYDEDNNLESMQLPDESMARWKYDALGRCIQTTNTKDQVRYFEYDRLSRICNMHLPDGNTVRLAYNAYEEIVQATDRHSKVQFEYTPLGNLKKRKQNNAEIQFLYDTEERLHAVVNEAGSHYTFSYNKRGEIIHETGFDGLQRRYELDATGKVIKTHRPGGHYTQYEYDANGRIVRVEYHDGSWELYNYDKNGNLKEAVNEYSTVRFERNKMGYVETEEQDGYLVHSRYDKAGARIHIASNLGADIQLHRNNLGLITNIQAKVNDLLWEAQMKYNQTGQEIERLLPGGLTSAWQYDQAGRPGEHKVSSRGVVQSWKKYTWEVNNRLNNVFDAISQANTHFKYDLMGNLAFVQYAGNSIVHRTTDATGNIYESVTKTDRKYNSAGALLESKKYIFKYDDEGNLVSKTDKTNQKKTYYEWLANGMLRKVVRPDGKAVEFTYDALNRRIAKYFNGIVTRWVWDGNVPLHEWQYHEKDKPKPIVNEWGGIIYDKQEPHPQNAPVEVNGITWIFEAGTSVPAAKIENGEQYSIICDHLGTPQGMYDAEGKKVWEGVLDIYGRIRTLSGNKSLLPFRYQGQYEDAETGLYYNRFRYYTPEEGIYISQDPIGLNGGNPTMYGYVKDPNVWTDVYGLKCKRTKTFKRQQKICDRYVGTLTGKKADEVEALLTQKGYTKSNPQAATPEKIQHTVFTRTTKSGDTYILDYHPGGTPAQNGRPAQSNIHGNDYWKVYKIENGGEKEVYGRIGHEGFKNYGDIKEPVYIDGVLAN